MDRLGCGVLIPTYNNSGTIASVIESAKQYANKVYVVNDGCTDDTKEVLSKIEGIKQIGYEKNRGKGVALKTGFKAMVEDGLKYAITLDADGQHKSEDIPLLIENVEEGDKVLVAGVRNIDTQEGMPSKNGFANKFSNFWFKIETGMDFPDTQCGMRLYPIAEMSRHHYFSTKYEYELEVLVRSVWQGIELKAQPVHVYYPPAEERVSHFRPFKDFSRISVLNTILVTIALLIIKPRDFVRKLTFSNAKKFVNDHLLHTPHSNAAVAISVGIGVCIGILPIWGFQIIVALAIAQLLGISKTITVLCSNVSIFPLTPFIIWAGYAVGALMTGGEVIPKFDFDQFTIDMVKNQMKQDAIQYLIGSTTMALAAGLTSGIATWCILKLKHGKKE